MTIEEAKRILPTEDPEWLIEKERQIHERILEWRQHSEEATQQKEKFQKLAEGAQRQILPHEKEIMEAHEKGTQETAEAALGLKDRIEKDIVAFARVRQREANMRMSHGAALEEEKNRKIKQAREQ